MSDHNSDIDLSGAYTLLSRGERLGSLYGAKAGNAGYQPTDRQVFLKNDGNVGVSEKDALNKH